LLSRYQAIKNELIADWKDAQGLPYWLLTLECGLKVGEAYVEWCDEAEKVMSDLAEGGTHETSAKARSASRKIGNKTTQRREASGHKR
jgi:hypothetical protein